MTQFSLFPINTSESHIYAQNLTKIDPETSACGLEMFTEHLKHLKWLLCEFLGDIRFHNFQQISNLTFRLKSYKEFFGKIGLWQDLEYDSNYHFYEGRGNPTEDLCRLASINRLHFHIFQIFHVAIKISHRKWTRMIKKIRKSDPTWRVDI